MKNMFDASPSTEEAVGKNRVDSESISNSEIKPPDYNQSPNTTFDYFINFVLGYVLGALVLFVFYRIPVLTIIGGIPVGAVVSFASQFSSKSKRLTNLRVQFYDMLESMAVSMRAGNPPYRALERAKSELLLVYPENSDIIAEINVILARFHNSIPLSVGFTDFAQRCGLEDVVSFASVYATIEGKSSKANEIIQDTQQIIADKMEIEMEIDSMMMAARNEANTMLVMPILILAIIGFAGAGFMDALFTTFVGRIVATVGLIVFIACFIMTQIFSKIKV